MIYLASDHRGFELKEKIKIWLEEWGLEFKDMGPNHHDPEDDYPDFVSLAAKEVSQKPGENRGIVLGHSGQGEAIVANKFKGVRAAVFYGAPERGSGKHIGGKSKDMIYLMREDDNTNILSLGASFLDDETAKENIQRWLETKFKGEERHVRRINKIKELEK